MTVGHAGINSQYIVCYAQVFQIAPITVASNFPISKLGTFGRELLPS